MLLSLLLLLYRKDSCRKEFKEPADILRKDDMELGGEVVLLR